MSTEESRKPMRLLERRWTEPARRMKASQFEKLRPKGGEVLFLGDSITEGGLWHEWFPEVGVLNRGIGGDTTDGVLGRLDAAVVDPVRIFLLIGTNDLYFRRPKELVRDNQRRIVAALRDRAPTAHLYVQSVMPRHKSFSSRIVELNAQWRALATEFDAEYVDLWPVLSDDRQSLNRAFTLDALHLNGSDPWWSV